MYEKKQNDSFTMAGNFAGIASFVLAVAGNNLDKLSLLQKYGLSISSAVMLWAFMGGVLFQHAIRHRDNHERGKMLGSFFFGGLIGAGLLLAILPFFSFGIGPDQRDLISLIASGTFAAAFVIMSLASLSAG